MVKTDDDPPEFPDEISTSSKKAKHDCCYSNEQYRLLIPTFQQLLPEEVLYEVFLRLPVKSLIRFRCLSKGMRRLIDSPVFVKSHNMLRSDEDYAILFNPNYWNRDMSAGLFSLLFSLDFEKDDDNNLNLNRAKAIDLNCSVTQEGEIMGCCNGVFCFKNFQSKCYVFWNPSNGTFRKVDFSSCKFSLHASMGYDCVNNDYKIISFIPSEASLEVFSLRNDSWRIFLWDRDFPLRHYVFRVAVCLGGVIYWPWINNADESVFIAAFDLATETFTSLPLPLEATQLHLHPYHFTDFGGRLCVTFLRPPRNLPYYPQTIWVMEKYGIESSWTKLHDFASTSWPIRNFYFPNTKKRLLCYCKWLSWWDPEDGSFEKIEIPGLLNDRPMCHKLCSSKAYVYVRNLVRLDQPLV